MPRAQGAVLAGGPRGGIGKIGAGHKALGLLLSGRVFLAGAAGNVMRFVLSCYACFLRAERALSPHRQLAVQGTI